MCVWWSGRVCVGMGTNTPWKFPLRIPLKDWSGFFHWFPPKDFPIDFSREKPRVLVVSRTFVDWSGYLRGCGLPIEGPVPRIVSLTFNQTPKALFREKERLVGSSLRTAVLLDGHVLSQICSEMKRGTLPVREKASGWRDTQKPSVPFHFRLLSGE